MYGLPWFADRWPPIIGGLDANTAFVAVSSNARIVDMTIPIIAVVGPSDAGVMDVQGSPTGHSTEGK